MASGPMHFPRCRKCALERSAAVACSRQLAVARSPTRVGGDCKVSVRIGEIRCWEAHRYQEEPLGQGLDLSNHESYVQRHLSFAYSGMAHVAQVVLNSTSAPTNTRNALDLQAKAGC